MRWYLALFVALGFALLSTAAMAQDDPPYECDDNFGQCGTPEQSGGGCGCGGGSILVANTDLGDTYQYGDDYDDDGLEDPYDNCPFVANLDQGDSDGDNFGDACDNCITNPNIDQSDIDGDRIGDVCDDDMDGDNIANPLDNCEMVPNVSQEDLDTDNLGDACDVDIDGDGLDNLNDGCPMDSEISDPSEDQIALCFPDSDADGTRDIDDICPAVYDPEQENLDGDEWGDGCDADIDNDGIQNINDNCRFDANELQLDTDRDGIGNECDSHFCFVVLGDEENCLDPSDAQLRVYSPDYSSVETGTAKRLRLFANRQNQAMRFVWTVVGAPEGSSATVENSKGSVTISTPFEYHYLSEQAAEFTPDLPGEYQLKLQVTTIWEDRVSSMTGQTAEYTMNLRASGDPVVSDDPSAGCQAVVSNSRTAWGGGLMVLLGLCALAWRRRRR